MNFGRIMLLPILMIGVYSTTIRLDAQELAAEQGIQFLVQKMNHQDLKYNTFENRSGFFELRLFLNGSPLVTSTKLIEIVSEYGESEFYIYSKKEDKFIQIAEISKDRGGMIINYSNKSFKFICSFGGARVIPGR